MSELEIRLGIIVVVGLLGWLLVKVGQSFVETKRRQALAAAPLFQAQAQNTPSSGEVAESSAPIRILAFSSEDCRQCHQLQTPALQRVLAARGAAVTVVDVDATTEHDLTQTYHILTVPSTVILDTAGNACAVNYGFAPTKQLLDQIDEVLTRNIQN